MNFSLYSYYTEAAEKSSGLIELLVPALIAAAVGIAAVIVSLIGVRESNKNLLKQLNFQKRQEHDSHLRENIASLTSLSSDLHFEIMYRFQLVKAKKSEPGKKVQIDQEIKSKDEIIGDKISQFDRIYHSTLLLLNPSEVKSKLIEKSMKKLYDIIRNGDALNGKSEELKKAKSKMLCEVRDILHKH